MIRINWQWIWRWNRNFNRWREIHLFQSYKDDVIEIICLKIGRLIKSRVQKSELKLLFLMQSPFYNLRFTLIMIAHSRMAPPKENSMLSEHTWCHTLRNLMFIMEETQADIRNILLMKRCFFGQSSEDIDTNSWWRCVGIFLAEKNDIYARREEDKDKEAKRNIIRYRIKNQEQEKNNSERAK